MHFNAFLFGPDADPDEVKSRFRLANPGAVVQTLKSEIPCGFEALELLAAQTFVALDSGELLAKKPEVDLLLRVARTAQISEAIRLVGAAKGRSFLVVIASQRRVRALAVGGRRMAKRGLSDEDLDAVEAGALLSAERS